jgi:tetratricopeptide (TPR) repeat protein
MAGRHLRSGKEPAISRRNRAQQRANGVAEATPVAPQRAQGGADASAPAQRGMAAATLSASALAGGGPGFQSALDGPVRTYAPLLSAIQAIYVALASLLVIGVAAYANSFDGRFMFDDTMWIGDPPPAFHDVGWYLQGLVFSSGRRLIELTAEINWALGHENLFGWHLFNVCVHLGCGLAVFGVARRTLLAAPMRGRFAGSATWLAWAIAAIFLVHPLNSEAVTFIWQRAHAVMALCQLVALYAIIRADSAAPPARWWWWGLALLMCDLGLDTKAQMVAMPLLVLAYDRTFLSRSWTAVYERNWPLYAGLGLVWWVSVGCLYSTMGGPGSDIGSRGVMPDDQGSGTMTRLEYARAQPEVVLRYLGLLFWPRQLCLDYVWGIPPLTATLVPWFAGLAALVAAAAVALWRWPLWGFLGVWFFLNLGPSSSIIQRPDVMVEHRMYVPMIAWAALVVVGGWLLAERACRDLRVALPLAGGALAVLLVALGWRTVLRNQDYQDHEVMWRKVIACAPANPRAHLNLGTTLGSLNRHEEALVEFSAAAKFKGIYPMAHYNRGTSLEKLKRNEEAVEAYREATRENQGYAEAWNNLGGVLITLGRIEESLVPLQHAITIRENQQAPYGVAYNNYGNALIQLGKAKEALPFLEKAVLYRPKLAEAWYNLGNSQVAFGHFDKALPAYQQAVQINPDYAEAHHNLALMLGNAARYREAFEQDKTALRLRPVYEQAQHTIQRWELALKQGGTLAPDITMPPVPAVTTGGGLAATGSASR